MMTTIDDASCAALAFVAAPYYGAVAPSELKRPSNVDFDFRPTLNIADLKQQISTRQLTGIIMRTINVDVRKIQDNAYEVYVGSGGGKYGILLDNPTDQSFKGEKLTEPNMTFDGHVGGNDVTVNVNGTPPETKIYLITA